MKVSDIQNEQNKIYALLKCLNIPPVEFKVAFDCMKITKQFIELNNSANKDRLTPMDVFEAVVNIMEPYL